MAAPKCFIPHPPAFLNRIDVPAAKSGKFRVEIQTSPKGKVFDTAPIRSAFFGGQESVRFTYPHATKWHRLLRDDGVLMSTIPCEQMQMMMGIGKTSGHVLVGGLGLGLVVNMLCERSLVARVTVVEREADVIKLVEPYLRKNDKPVEVVNGDIFKHLELPSSKRAYTSAFFDTWSGDGVATLYSSVIPLLYRCSKAGLANVSCWQEEVMRGQVYLGIMAQLAAFRDKIGKPDPTDLWGYTAQVAHALQVKEQLTADGAARAIARDFGVPGFEREHGIKASDMKTWLALAEGMRD
jgi:hypothetical protein